MAMEIAISSLCCHHRALASLPVTTVTPTILYRKFHPYGEPVKRPVEPDHHVFETDFGVRFGLFTCFDIEFLEPAIVMARQYSVSHFVFPHCWISELPFLTAVQAQWGWSWGLDVVLLSAGCNQPGEGGSGSGVYHGQRGALATTQTDTHGSTMLIATVPIKNHNNTGTRDPEWYTYSGHTRQKFTHSWKYSAQNMNKGRFSEGERENASKLVMLRDYIDVYETWSMDFNYHVYEPTSDNSTVLVTETMEKTICQNTLCCDFNIKVSTMFSRKPYFEPRRGDDFSQLHYRLGVFDGVRWYGGGLATGGLQVCGVIPCVNDSISSCGLRADDPSSHPHTLSGPVGTLYKIGTKFESISISGRFASNNTFIYPDLFVAGREDSFGALVSSEQFSYSCTYSSFHGDSLCSLRIQGPLPRLITAAIYARLFDRDGQPRTEIPQSLAVHQSRNLLVLAILSVIILHLIV